MPRFAANNIEREGKSYFALCPELDITSREETVVEARSNSTEAFEYFSSCRPVGNQEPLTPSRMMKKVLWWEKRLKIAYDFAIPTEVDEI
jgi:hypothetical protein